MGLTDKPSASFQPVQVTYDEATANSLAQEVAEQSEGNAVACLLCPDVFLALERSAPDVEALLLDFDPTYSQVSGATTCCCP